MFTNDKINGTPYFYKKRDGTNRSFNLRRVFLNFMFQKEKSEQKILNNLSRLIQQVPDSCFNL